MLAMFRKIALTIITLVIGGLISFKIVKMTPKAELKPQVNNGLLVEAQRFAQKHVSAVVIGQGVVAPSEQVNLIAQVSGTVKKLHPEVMIGGLVNKRDRLLQIDPTDYSIAVREARARVKIAQQELTLEAGRREVARGEWEMMKTRRADQTVSAEAEARALRAPQAEIAESNLKIAKNALSRAQVGYGRTILKAPFNAVIMSESVDLGQLVGPGAPIMTIAGTDTFWVTASVPTSELGWIDFPKRRRRGDKRSKKRTRSQGSKALIRYDMGSHMIEREANVLRQLTQIEMTGRMARVVLEVNDPLGLKSDERALLLGAQVEVKIMGRDLGKVIELPRSAIHNEDELWIFKREDQQTSPLKGEDIKLGGEQQVGILEVRKVKVFRKRLDSVFIKEGLEDEEYVITSRLSTPVPGMRLRGAL